MRLETKTVTILLCAALALSACTKKTITPAEDPQPAEVGFTASSQAVWVKGGETPTTSFPYDNFGVWGIARQNNLIYNLWGNEALMDVNKNTATGYYEPEETAYWVGGYTYNFLALAPYADAGLTLSGITTKEDQAGVTSPSDYLTFTYDMSGKYAAGNYTFDLLGAAAQTPVTTGGYDESQQLVFWHLLSQIEIKNIGFASGISGTVNKVHFKAFPSGEYIVSYDNNEALNLTAPTKVESEVITKTSNNTDIDKSDVIILNPNFNTSAPIIHIIPQKVEYLELYIDFSINEGASTAEYQGFKIDLTAQELEEYVYNGKYNWNITIGTKNSVSFEVVKVNEWKPGDATNEFPLQ